MTEPDEKPVTTFSPPNTPPPKPDGRIQKKATIWLDSSGWHCYISKDLVTVRDVRQMQRALRHGHREYIRACQLQNLNQGKVT